MKKARLLILVGLLFITNAVQASDVHWINSGGKVLYSWHIGDGYSDMFVSESYYACTNMVNVWTARQKHQH
jgi:hypothetical protein